MIVADTWDRNAGRKECLLRSLVVNRPIDLLTHT